MLEILGIGWDCQEISPVFGRFLEVSYSYPTGLGWCFNLGDERAVKAPSFY